MSKKISNGFVEVVDTSQFDETINSFRNAIKQYRNARNLVFNSTERLLSNWEGEGQQAFKLSYDLLKTQLKDEEDNLRTIAENLEDIKETYIEWDQATASSLSGN